MLINITIFICITIFYGIDNILRNISSFVPNVGIFCIILSIQHNNVMWVSKIPISLHMLKGNESAHEGDFYFYFY